jgi:hypothetical protein
MKLGCLVLAYHLPRQLARLLSVLQHSDIRVYLHIDRRKPLDPFRRAIEEEGVDDLVLLPRHRSAWGSIRVVDAELDGLAAALNDGCDYLVNISGQDFPVQPIDRIPAFLEEHGHRSFISCWRPSEAAKLGMTEWNGRYRNFYAYRVRGHPEVCFPRGEDVSFLSFEGRALNQLLRLRSALKGPRRHPTYFTPWVGTTWWNMSRPAAEYVLDFVQEHPDYHRYQRYTWLPEEVFFSSILLGTEFAERYEVIRDDLRFIDWPTGASRPRVLTSDDLPALLDSGKLFARKFDESVDADVLTQLAAMISA